MTQDGPGDGDASMRVPSAPTEGLPDGYLAPGQVLGDRYQIKSQLGRGGMGEVWRAFDLKLRVEVALKAMLPELFKNERRRDLLRREVRAAREVVSPNVCRIFDLIEVDGRELVSMEYVDGGTLLNVLHERGPLDLKEAQDIASQFLAGLEAIHQAGLVHRDVKPENIMITRAGRVVLMDFGLARQEDSGAGTVSGTPAYMAPEQAMGGKVDARADVYSAGVVLAEMVSPDGIKDLQSRQSVWEGIRHEPARVPDSPWAPVLKKAVAKEPDQRFNSAHTLTRALEDVTLRVEGAEDLMPYPGLASFTEEDAEYFFGREAEVEQMWRRLEGPPRLSAIVGPSGTGKTSFLRAGLVPSAGAEWGIVRTTPGNTAFASLRQALAAELAGDAEAIQELVRADESEALLAAVGRWRKGFPRALVIIDQFEELFTLNSHEIQAGFAEMVARLPLDAETFVLLSMRDDFLMGCNPYEGLRPVFADLMALDPPTGANLRRALVQPAMKCGYRFENDELVDEMLSEVEGERGALPLLAFAAARLWEKRDRDNGLLTRQAYTDIGGVGGALAHHAEATIDSIGSEHIPIVRDLFRNLVTAEGTRAVREWDELLSIFSDSRSESPEEVLRQLIDARLLTSYEIREEDEAPTRRVEIIHESLLANWPRLVRWQTQDQEGAQLRDELRQAARAWEEHGRHNDRLWTGTAYREFQLWRERYPGGLTDTEESFAVATTAHAGRRQRRRRMVVAVVLLIAATVTAATTALWRRSVLQERRAEAQKLIALGQIQMEEFPTAALAYAMQSLEMADSENGRLLALQALWEGPTAFLVNDSPSLQTAFSRGGNWLVQSHDFLGTLAIISRDGLQRIVDHPPKSSKRRAAVKFNGVEDLFISMTAGFEAPGVALWSAPEARLLATAVQMEERDSWGGYPVIDGDAEKPRTLWAIGKGDRVTLDAYYADGNVERLGDFRMSAPPGQGSDYCLDNASGDWLAIVEGNDVSVSMIGDEGLSDRHMLGRHEGHVRGCMADPLGRFFWTVGESDWIRQWDPTGEQAPKDLKLPPDIRPLMLLRDGKTLLATLNTNQEYRGLSFWSFGGSGFDLIRRDDDLQITRIAFDPVASRFAMRGPASDHRLWSLAAPAAAEPLILRRGPASYTDQPGFSPDGKWLATNDRSGLMMWPLDGPYPVVIKHIFQTYSHGVAFGPDGRFLATTTGNEVRVWPLDGPVPRAGHIVFTGEGGGNIDVAVSPDGEHFAVGSTSGSPVLLLGKDGEEPLNLAERDGLKMGTGGLAFSPDGRFLAGHDNGYDPSNIAVHVWDVATRKRVAVLRLDGEEYVEGYPTFFTTDGHVLTRSTKGILAWDIGTGEHEVLIGADVQRFAASGDGRRLLVTETGEGDGMQAPSGSPFFVDLQADEATTLTTHGLDVREMALDQEGGVVVTADSKGTIRVGTVSGEEPHLLLGHEDQVLQVVLDPNGRWIASTSTDGTLRLWPMPDLANPPLHTLPRNELIAKLKTLTNLRVVRNEESPTGWKLEVGPFPGWETVPTW